MAIHTTILAWRIPVNRGTWLAIAVSWQRVRHGGATKHSDFGAQEIKSVTVSTISASICIEVVGPDAMILVVFFFFFEC